MFETMAMRIYCAPGAESRDSRSQEDFVHIAPAPVLAGLERLHHRMLGLMKMLGGVLVLGGVTAAYMAALEAQPQVNPGVLHLETFLAASATGRDFLDVFRMGTGLRHCITSLWKI